MNILRKQSSTEIFKIWKVHDKNTIFPAKQFLYVDFSCSLARTNCHVQQICIIVPLRYGQICFGYSQSLNKAMVAKYFHVNLTKQTQSCRSQRPKSMWTSLTSSALRTSWCPMENGSPLVFFSAQNGGFSGKNELYVPCNHWPGGKSAGQNFLHPKSM